MTATGAFVNFEGCTGDLASVTNIHCPRSRPQLDARVRLAGSTFVSERERTPNPTGSADYASWKNPERENIRS